MTVGAGVALATITLGVVSLAALTLDGSVEIDSNAGRDLGLSIGTNIPSSTIAARQAPGPLATSDSPTNNNHTTDDSTSSTGSYAETAAGTETGTGTTIDNLVTDDDIGSLQPDEPAAAPLTTELADDPDLDVFDSAVEGVEVRDALLDPSTLPPFELLDDGVFGNDGDRLERLAAFVVIEGMVFTSSSAVADHERVGLLIDETWVEADVLIGDGISDVAVLGVDPAGHDRFLEATAAAWYAAANTDSTGTGSYIELRTADGSGGETIHGVVIGADERTIARSGTAVYGALSTSAQLPEGAGGSALINDDGFIVALVVDSADYLLSAIPIDRVVDIGRSFLRWGMPAVEWLGITGQTSADGGVRLDDVVPDGPADQAELQPGDVIIAIDGQVIHDADHLAHVVRETDIGSTIAITVDRGNLRHVLRATIGQRTLEVSE